MPRFSTKGSPAPPASHPLTDQSRAAQLLRLRMWEALGAERTVTGILNALESVLLPVVKFDTVGIVELNGGLKELASDRQGSRLVDTHVVGYPRKPGETLEAFVARSGVKPTPLPETRPPIPYPQLDPDTVEDCEEPFICDNLLTREGWYPHEFRLASFGVHSYASLLLKAGGRVFATAVFNRMRPSPFLPREIEALRTVAVPLSVAAVNALAMEVVLKLREELAAENSLLREQLGQAPWFGGIVGNSPGMRQVRTAIEQVAPTEATVLITGETGTGKELAARAIHQRSQRVHGPMVKVNCAAIPATLIASELFGHERGAFTGAVERRKGRFEQADGGTLFLDEVGELPGETQVLLLRVLQEREFERLGGSQTLQANVRVVAATNRDLAAEVEAGRFRRDLYYRLNVFPVHLPPLRERTEEIPALVAHFAEKQGLRLGRRITRIERKSLDSLRGHPWPGNVRELENLVERAVILAEAGVLRFDPVPVPHAPTTKREDLEEQALQAERRSIEAALQVSGGKVAGASGAAFRLGMPASTVEFRIKKLGIEKRLFRRANRSAPVISS